MWRGNVVLVHYVQFRYKPVGLNATPLESNTFFVWMSLHRDIIIINLDISNFQPEQKDSRDFLPLTLLFHFHVHFDSSLSFSSPVSLPSFLSSMLPGLTKNTELSHQESGLTIQNLVRTPLVCKVSKINKTRRRAYDHAGTR